MQHNRQTADGFATLLKDTHCSTHTVCPKGAYVFLAHSAYYDRTKNGRALKDGEVVVGWKFAEGHDPVYFAVSPSYLAVSA